AKLVSVIMPCYNGEQYIRESIESVLQQTYKNWELIIIDDASNDNSVMIVNDFLNDSRIKLLTNNYEKGAAGARQTGIDSSNGQLIAFLDSDDLWMPQKLEKQVEHIESKAISFSFSNYIVFNDRQCKCLTFPARVSYSRILFNCPIGNSTVMLTRELATNKKIPIMAKEDYAFWIELLKQGIIAHNIGSSEMMYRLSDSSVSSNKLSEISKQFKVLNEVAGLNYFKCAFYTTTYIVLGVLKRALNPLKNKD
ncbi:glycosyltransferase family 2 protein, partial [Vibrio parahaemolyticus]|nr:glycosyltransferase family 2 protein [Vibrio parahaemolyticus]